MHRRQLQVKQLRIVIGNGIYRATERVEVFRELTRRPCRARIGPVGTECRERRAGSVPPFDVRVRLVEGEQEAGVQYRADSVEEGINLSKLRRGRCIMDSLTGQ